MRCLAAIRDTLPAGIEAEVLVLDNASGDGSAEAVGEWNEGPEGLGERLRLIALDRRRGKAENDSTLLAEAAGRVVFAPERGHRAVRGRDRGTFPRRRGRAERRRGRRAAPGGGRNAVRVCLAPPGRDDSALSGALSPQAPGHPGRPGARDSLGGLGAVGSDAGAPKRRGGGRLPRPRLLRLLGRDRLPKATSRRRLGRAEVPWARAVHHEQLTNDRVAGRRRLVEFHRNRDLYMRKHHGAASAAVVRALTAWAYAVRALVALVLPGRDAGWFWLHARLALTQGQGIREAAAELNARLDIPKW